MAMLLTRRLNPAFIEQAEALARNTRQQLAALRRGENVFGITTVLEAGVMHFETVRHETIEALNLLPTRANRFFPQTEQRTPRS